jgi:Fe-S oxidoreductase
VACPFCTVMLDDGVRETGAKLQVVDLATLLSEAVERRKAWDAGAGASPSA